MAVAGLILGIIALIVNCFSFYVYFFPFIMLALAVTGLVLAALSGRRTRSRLAAAAIIVCIVAVVTTGIMSFSCSICYLVS